MRYGIVKLPYKKSNSVQQANRRHKHRFENMLFAARKGLVPLNEFPMNHRWVRDDRGDQSKRASLYARAFLRGFMKHLPKDLKSQIMGDTQGLLGYMQTHPQHFINSDSPVPPSTSKETQIYLIKVITKRMYYRSMHIEGFDTLQRHNILMQQLVEPLGLQNGGVSTLSRAVVDHLMYKARRGLYTMNKLRDVAWLFQHTGHQKRVKHLYLGAWSFIKSYYNDPRSEELLDRWSTELEEALFEK